MSNDYQFETKLKHELSADQMLKLIFHYAGKIGNEKKLDKLLMLMADMGRELIVSDRCTVWLLDKEKNELWTKVAHGVSELRIPAGTGLVGHAITEKEQIVIDDAYTDPRFNPEPDKRTGYHTKSILVIPIYNNEEEIIGAFQAINKMTASECFSPYDIDRLNLVASYSGKSLESAFLVQEIEETQREIVLLMGEVGESRSKETGNHVKRVAEYSKLLALLIGMSEEEASLLKEASPMHDIGKVAIPDSILKKPGKLTEEEFDVMKSHTDVGYGILNRSQRKIIKSASIVAYEHHEKYNGKGYPRGIAGENIHIYGRITAVADVFDALGSDRCYKAAWELDRILNLFKEERGQHFCPVVIDAFLNNLDKFIAIRDKHQDVINMESINHG